MISQAAQLKVLEKLLGDVYLKSKDVLNSRLKKWASVSQINKLYRKLAQVRQVKTIGHFDKPVDLMKFYYPTKIRIQKKIIEITSIDDLNGAGNVLIQGTAGQGKSIFLRYLCSQELMRGKAIPVFAELRKVNTTGLSGLIFSTVDSLGIPMDHELFDWLASNGYIILFLDAFDEVENSFRQKTIQEIEALATKHQNLRIVISSRPGSSIEYSNNFQVLKLEALNHKDVEAIITHLTEDTKFVENLKAALSKSKVKQLLTTPLMVTLLVITYKAYQTLPDQLSEFYDGLFLTLLARHDQTKPGYLRPRSCGLNDMEIRHVFDGTCFNWQKSGLSESDRETLEKFVAQALTLERYNAKADAFVSDMKSITCLLVEDAQRFSIIHKSVREYHSACFVRRRSDENVKKFYDRLRLGNWRDWAAELSFLSQIDKFRFLKYYYIPDIHEQFGLNDKSVLSKAEWREIITKNLDELLRLQRIAKVPNQVSISAVDPLRRCWAPVENIILKLLFEELREMDESLLQEFKSSDQTATSKDRPSGNLYRLNGSHAIAIIKQTARGLQVFNCIVDELVDKYYAEYGSANAFVENEISSSKCFDDIN